MKKTLFFLPFLIFNTFLHSSSAQKPTPVLEIDGKPLRTDSHYYILPIFRGRGGGLTLSSADNETCPLDVVQEQSEVQPGLPLSFAPATPSKGVVRVSTDLNIMFYAATVCVQSTVWKLNYVAGIGQYVIGSDGVEGNPGRQTIDNWFKIEKYDDRDYKLVFCPTVCKYCKVICKDVGIFIHNERRLLALSDVPFRVMFRRA